MSTNQKVAIVTGASQGIGAGLVQGYLDRGYRVVANSRSIQPGKSGLPGVFGVPGDISDPQVAHQVVQAAVEQFGRVDTLINNACVFVAKSFVDYTPEDYQKVLSTNVAGFFYVTQEAVREMLKQKSGHIVRYSIWNQPDLSQGKCSTLMVVHTLANGDSRQSHMREWRRPRSDGRPCQSNQSPGANSPLKNGSI